MKKALLICTLSLITFGFAEQQPAVKPRSKVENYPGVQVSKKLAIGAAQLSAKQVRKALVSNLRKDYLVIEVGVYPKEQAKISPRDFVLSTKGEAEQIHPINPETMAYNINQKDQSGHDVAITPTMNVEYSTGPDPNDPYAPSDRRNRGLTVSKGVMVTMDNNKKSPKAAAGDLKAMKAELKEKGLPETIASRPIAGYLYFPVKSGQRGPYQLKFNGADGPVVIDLAPPAE